MACSAYFHGLERRARRGVSISKDAVILTKGDIFPHSMTALKTMDLLEVINICGTR